MKKTNVARALTGTQRQEMPGSLPLVALYAGGWALVALASGYPSNSGLLGNVQPVFPFPMPPIPLISPSGSSQSAITLSLVALSLVLMLMLSVLLRRGLRVALLNLGTAFGGCLAVALSLSRLAGNSRMPGDAASLLGLIVIGAELFVLFSITAILLAALCQWAACSAPQELS